MQDYVIWFEQLRLTDVPRAGDRNAVLGELQAQAPVPALRAMSAA